MPDVAIPDGPPATYDDLRVYHDMTEHGFERDDWPPIQTAVMNADILVIATPIWLGDKSSDGIKHVAMNVLYNTTFMAWNVMHLARLLKDSGGIPEWGNIRCAWDDGVRFDHPNREYR